MSTKWPCADCGRGVDAHVDPITGDERVALCYDCAEERYRARQVCGHNWCEEQASLSCARCGRPHCRNHLYTLHQPGQVQFFCRECIQGGPQAPRAVGAFKPPQTKQPRQPPQAMTFLAFCRLCEAEIYRKEHIRRRTKQVLEAIDLEPSLAWMKHALTMRRLGGLTAYEHNQRHWQARTWRGEPDAEASPIKGLIVTAWIAEDRYDPTLQVGDPSGPVVPEHMRMLSVIQVLAGGISGGLRRLSEEQVVALKRLWGDAWDNPADPDSPEEEETIE